MDEKRPAPDGAGRLAFAEKVKQRKSLLLLVLI